jgi:hypothetical protein
MPSPLNELEHRRVIGDGVCENTQLVFHHARAERERIRLVLQDARSPGGTLFAIRDGHAANVAARSVTASKGET